MSETARSQGHVHRYHATCHWAGDTAIGYESYVRAHLLRPPASTELMLSPTDRRVMLVKSRQQRCKELS